MTTKESGRNWLPILTLVGALVFVFSTLIVDSAGDLINEIMDGAGTYATIFFVALLSLLLLAFYVMLGPAVAIATLWALWQERRAFYLLPLVLVALAVPGYFGFVLPVVAGLLGSGQFSIMGIRI